MKKMTEKMTEKKITNTFIEKNIRVEKIIHLGTQCMDRHRWPEIAQDAFEEDWDEIWEALDLSINESNDEIWQWQDILYSNQKLGYLVQFATPRPTEFDKNGYSYSWGVYLVKWIYSEDFYTACEKALAWQQEYIARCRDKSSVAE